MRQRGAIQRRYRAALAGKGWTSVTTYIRVEHRKSLEKLKRQRGLRNLHEALDLVLAGSPLADSGATSLSPASLPRLPAE